jgi:hypothetical protein
MINIPFLLLLGAIIKKQKHIIQAPSLRRQIAGNLENPYDLNYPDNFDIKLFCDEYQRLYGKEPGYDLISQISINSCQENMSWLLSFLSRL